MTELEMHNHTTGATEEERADLRDGLLAVGPVAVPLALRRFLGEPEWSRIREEVGL